MSLKGENKVSSQLSFSGMATLVSAIVLRVL